MTVEHVLLTGSQLHEPKGVSAATQGHFGFASSGAVAWGAFTEGTSGTASASSQLAFTDLSEYLYIRLTVTNLLRATSGTTLRMQFSSDNGSSYYSDSTYTTRWFDDAADDGEDTSSANITGDEDSTYLYWNGLIHIYNFNSSVETHWDSFGIKSTSSGGGGSSSGVITSGGMEGITTAWNALRLYSSSGNLTSGSVYLEGFRGT